MIIDKCIRLPTRVLTTFLSTALTVFSSIALNACGPEEETLSQVDEAAEQKIVSRPATAKKTKTAAKRQRYYCNQIVAQVQAEPKTIGTCRASGYGSRQKEMKELNTSGTLIPERNEASIKVSAPSLEAIGLEVFSFSVNRGVGKPPKFETGVFVMDQAHPKEWPNNQARGTNFSNSEAGFTVATPMANFLREELHPNLLTGYEITSSVLTIEYVKDLDEEDISAAKVGTQYVRGTLAVTLVPLGSTGDSYSGAFEFGGEVNWGIFKG